MALLGAGPLARGRGQLASPVLARGGWAEETIMSRPMREREGKPGLRKEGKEGLGRISNGFWPELKILLFLFFLSNFISNSNLNRIQTSF